MNAKHDPIFTHDCASCVYLGRASVTEDPCDLYVCPSRKDGGVLTVIARFGPDSEYASGLIEIEGRPMSGLVEAMDRAEALGYRPRESKGYAKFTADGQRADPESMAARMEAQRRFELSRKSSRMKGEAR